MEEKILLNELDYKVINLLHQIQELNKMILLHSSEGGIELMKIQYEALSNRYKKELDEVLNQYIGNHPFAMAA